MRILIITDLHNRGASESCDTYITRELSYRFFLFGSEKIF